jgi:hypothetical protein
VTEESSKNEYERVFRGAYESDDAFMNQTLRRKLGQYPNFSDKDEKPDILAIKMTRFHNLIVRILELFENLKMVSIVRHPCAAVHSWLTAPNEFPSTADPMKEWRSGSCRKTGPEEFWGFDDWKRVTRLHMKMEDQYPGRFRIVQYESLVSRLFRETHELFDFLGLDYTEQTARFLKSCHDRHDEDPYAVFKDPSVKDRWRFELDSQIRGEILRETGNSDLARFLV